MATRYVNTGSTTGGDGTTNLTTGATRAYVSLSAWEAARQAHDTEEARFTGWNDNDVAGTRVASFTYTGTCAHVASQNNGGGGASATAQVTLGTTTAGQLVVVTVSWYTATLGATPITDSNSNTWTQIGTELNLSGGSLVYQRMYYCVLATGGASHTVTFTTPGTGSYPTIVANRFSASSFTYGLTAGVADGTPRLYGASTQVGRSAPLTLLVGGLALGSVADETVNADTSKLAWTIPSGGSYTTGTGSTIAATQYYIATTAYAEEVLCCGSTADTTIASIDGWMTGAANYISVKGNSGHANGRHPGYWSTSHYRVEITTPGDNYGCIQIYEAYVRIEGIQVYKNHDQIGRACLNFAYHTDEARDHRTIACVLRGTGSETVGDQKGINGADTGGLTAVNNIIHDIAGAGSNNGGIRCSSTSSTRGVNRLYNNTVQNCTVGYRTHGTDNSIAKNCLAQDCPTTCFTGTWATGTVNNASDDNTQPGTSGVNGEAVFANEGGKDFRLGVTDTVATNLGADLSLDANYALITDLLGNIRGGTWDIGAHEYGATTERKLTRYVNTASSAGGDGTTNETSGAYRAYASLSAWEAARQDNLTTLGYISEVLCCGTTADTTCTVTSWVTNATYYVHIKGNPGHANGRHPGYWSTNHYRVTGNDNFLAALALDAIYTKCEGIQAYYTGTQFGSAVSLGDASDPSGIWLIACLGRSDTVDSGTVLGTQTPADTYPTVAYGCINCVASQPSTDSTNAQGVFYLRTRGTAHAYAINCTAHGGRYGFKARDIGGVGHSYMYNCASVNGGVGAVNEAHGDWYGSHLAFDIGTDPLTSGVDISAYSDAQIFLDAANRDFRLAAGSPLIDVGLDQSLSTVYPFITDLLWNVRRYTWDIGAHEYGATADAILTRYVNTGSTAGGDGSSNLTTGAYRAYASLSAWEAARQHDLVTAGNVEEVLCCGSTADSTNVDVSGWTASAAYYASIKGNPGHANGRHAGVWSTSHYRLVTTSLQPLHIGIDYTRVEGIQAHKNYSNSSHAAVRILDSSSIGGVRVIGVIARAATSALGGVVHATLGAGELTAPNYVINCVAYVESGVGFYLRTGSTVQSYIMNCTAYGGTAGIKARGSQCYVYNTACVGSTTAVDESQGTFLGSHVAFDQGTDPLTSGVDVSGYTDAQIFVDAANGDFRLAANSPLIDVGTDLSASFTTDIAGTTRPTGANTWDIGAWEYVSGVLELTTATITSGAALYAPTVANQTQELTASTIASTATLSVPSLALTLVTDFLATAAAVFVPALALTLSLATISSAETTYAPEVGQTLELPTVGSTEVVSPATVAGASDHIWSTVVLYPPTVEVVALELTTAFLANTETLYAPSLSLEVTTATLESTAAVNVPDVAQTLVLETLGSTATLSAPTVAPGDVTLTTAFLASSETVYAATVANEGGAAQDVTTVALSSTEVLYAPSLALNVETATIGSTETVSAPTVVPGDVALTLPTLDSTAAVYDVTVAPGENALALPAIASTATLYGPTFSLEVTTAYVGTTETLYAPSLTLNVSLPTLGSTEALFAPSLTAGDVALQLPTVGSTEAVYAAQVAPGENALVTPFMGSTSAVYTPTLALYATTSTVSSTAAVYPAAIALTLELPTLGTTSALYAPTLEHHVALSTIGSTETVHAVTVGMTVTLPTVASTVSVYAVSTAAVVELSTIGSGIVLYAPTLQAGEATLTLPAVAAGTALYTPTVYNDSIVIINIGAETFASAAMSGETLVAPAMLGETLVAPSMGAETFEAGGPL